MTRALEYLAHMCALCKSCVCLIAHQMLAGTPDMRTGQDGPLLPGRVYALKEPWGWGL
jgi:hypothetical protein